MSARIENMSEGMRAKVAQKWSFWRIMCKNGVLPQITLICADYRRTKKKQKTIGTRISRINTDKKQSGLERKYKMEGCFVPRNDIFVNENSPEVRGCFCFCFLVLGWLRFFDEQPVFEGGYSGGDFEFYFKNKVVEVGDGALVG